MPWGTTVLTGIKWVPHEEQDMSESLTELFADTRAVQEANGSYTITSPSEIAARYGIEAGDVRLPAGPHPGTIVGGGASAPRRCSDST